MASYSETITATAYHWITVLLRKKGREYHQLLLRNKNRSQTSYKPDVMANVNHSVTIMTVMFDVSNWTNDCINLMKCSFVSSQNAKLHIGMMIVTNRRHINSSTKPSTMYGIIHAGRFYLNDWKSKKQHVSAMQKFQ